MKRKIFQPIFTPAILLLVLSFCIPIERLAAAETPWPSASTSIPFAVIRVPDDYATIQEAVDAAQDGDVLIVMPGTYTISETILIDKRITLVSRYFESGDPADIQATVITSASGLDPLVQFDPGSENSVCSGLTFSGAHKQLTVMNTYMEITYCEFYDSASDALSLEGAGAYIGYNYFENCGDEAIDADDSLDWIVEYNTIINPGDDGLEIRLHNNDMSARTHEIRYNYISGAAEDGIQLIDYDGDSGRTFYIHHNIIRASAMVGLGCTSGGNTVENFEGSDMVEPAYVYNNVFDLNNHGITGAGNMLVVNSVISNSQVVGIKKLDGNSIADFNCFFNNSVNLENAATGADNLDADPLFLPDYQVESGSPVIDTGVRNYTAGSLSITVSDADIVGAEPDRGAKEFGSGTPGGNTAPQVSAGPDQLVIAPDSQAELQGLVADDGLPEPASLTLRWEVISSPEGGSVQFTSPDQASTQATFSLQGRYELRLTADDGELERSDIVRVDFVAGFNDTRTDLTGSDYIEAEDYRFLVGEASEQADSRASAGAYVRADSNGPCCPYTEHSLVTYQEGTYYVWISVSGPDAASNGLSVSFADPEEVRTLDGAVPVQFGEGSWYLAVFENIPEGVYPLRIFGAEPGVTWDRIFVSTSPDDLPFSPTPLRVSASPVPASNGFTIALPGTGAAKVHMYALSGRLVYETTANGQLNLPVDVTGLATGVYLVRVAYEDDVTLLKMVLE